VNRYAEFFCYARSSWGRRGGEYVVMCVLLLHASEIVTHQQQTLWCSFVLQRSQEHYKNKVGKGK
jgi:hypothetical protein